MRVPVVWELTSEGTTQRCGVGLVRERKRAERRAQHSQPVVYGMGWGGRSEQKGVGDRREIQLHVCAVEGGRVVGP